MHLKVAMQLLSVSSRLSSNDLMKANRFSLIDLAVHTMSLCPSVEIDTAEWASWGENCRILV